MKSKLTLVTLLVTAFLLQVHGQERSNRKKLIFETTSGTLAQATGWAYNATLGEWVDYENVISADKDFKDKYTSLKGSWMMSNEIQNFQKVQTRTITYNGILYYVLMVEKWSGQYEYPALHMDWYTYKQTIGYIFSKVEYQKLMNLESLVVLKTQYVVSMGSKYEDYDEIKFLDLIQTELSKEKSEYSSKYTFPIMKSKEGAIRFYLPDNFSTYNKYNFEKQYFETDLDKFTAIILK